jgi:hypothetical protein
VCLTRAACHNHSSSGSSGEPQQQSQDRDLMSDARLAITRLNVVQH